MEQYFKIHVAGAAEHVCRGLLNKFKTHQSQRHNSCPRCLSSAQQDLLKASRNLKIQHAQITSSTVTRRASHVTLVTNCIQANDCGGEYVILLHAWVGGTTLPIVSQGNDRPWQRLGLSRGEQCAQGTLMHSHTMFAFKQ